MFMSRKSIFIILKEKHKRCIKCVIRRKRIEKSILYDYKVHSLL